MLVLAVLTEVKNQLHFIIAAKHPTPEGHICVVLSNDDGCVALLQCNNKSPPVFLLHHL